MRATKFLLASTEGGYVFKLNSGPTEKSAYIPAANFKKNSLNQRYLLRSGFSKSLVSATSTMVFANQSTCIYLK